MSLHRANVRLVAAAALALSAIASTARATALGDIFVIDLENHNWTQPDGNVAAAPVGGNVTTGTVGSSIQQIYGNTAAPYINSLVTPGNANAAQTSFTNSYYNVLSTPSGNNPSIHPSEPNYLWQESGSNFGIANDNDPYGSGNNVAVIQAYLAAHPNVSGQNLSALIQNAGISWKAYQEDTNLQTSTGQNANVAAYNGTLGNTGGTLTSTAVANNSTTVPLASFSGTSATYTNPYNGSHQYNFAAKHDGSLFFTDTNGGNDPSTANVEAGHYAPMQQLQTDLTNNSVSRYNLITPDQYNDMHTGLTGGFTDPRNNVHYTGDAAQIAQGDNFLSVVVPQIEASAAYKNNGAIMIWTDETEPDSTYTSGSSYNDYQHTLSEILISPLAKGNAYNSSLVYTHSSDVATLQNIFGTPANTTNGYLNDAATPGTNTLSDMFVSGTIPTAVPEPASLGIVALGAMLSLSRRRRI